MADEDRGRELPQRVRGAARPGPPPPASSSPCAAEELRQRMQAAVIAERAGAAVQSKTGPPGSDVTTRPQRPSGTVRPRPSRNPPAA